MNKIIKKPWGREIWLEDGSKTPYALKHILFLQGNRTSLQVHRYKCETIYVTSGTGKLYRSVTEFDIDKFLEEGMTKEEVEAYENQFEVIELYPGVSFTNTPGIVHRVVATTDLEFIEASTTELDDVIRLQDDSNRSNGRINSEHQ